MMEEPTHKPMTKTDIAFYAMLRYETNAIKYDSDNPNTPTSIPKSERIEIFAKKYGTTVGEMLDQRFAVEQHISSTN